MEKIEDSEEGPMWKFTECGKQLKKKKKTRTSCGNTLGRIHPHLWSL